MSILSPTALADLAERLQRPVEVGAGDVVAARGLGRRVERPDLHAGDALLQQRERHLVGAVQEAFQVLVGAGVVAQAPVLDLLQAGVADVLVAGAGVVGADALAGAAAQELDHGLVGGLAPQVPERDVDRRGGAGLDAGRAEAQIAVELGRDQVDRVRVDAEDAGGHDLVQERLDRGRGHEGLAQAVEAVLAVDADPEDVGELEQPDRLQLGDLHADAPVACSSSMRASSMISSMARSAASASRGADRRPARARAWRGPGPSGSASAAAGGS